MSSILFHATQPIGNDTFRGYERKCCTATIFTCLPVIQTGASAF
jgi:hypothetical protein